MTKPIVVSILADAGGVDRGTRQAEGFLGRLGRRAGQVAKIVGVAGAAAVVAVGISSVNAASEAQQSIGASEQIYGKYADTVIAKSNQASQAVGLSANEYRELSNGLGAMLKNAGTPMDALSGKTDKLVGLGADLAATFGGTTKDAVAAISSLMRGEADPIERFGVSIKQSDVNARLAADGLGKLTGSARKEAESTARLALLYEQTASAQGQFGREGNTLAGQQQRLSAQWEDMKAGLGTRLLPVMTKAFGYLNTNGPAAFAAVERGIDALMPGVRAVVGILRDTVSVGADLVGFLHDNAAAIGVVAGGYLAYKAITLGVAAAEWALYLWQSRKVLLGAAHIAITNGMTAAQTGLNAAMRANPIGLVIGLLTLVGVGLVMAWQHSATFRAVVTGAFNGVVAAGKALWSGIQWAFGKITTGLSYGAKAAKLYLGMYVLAFKLVIAGGKAMGSAIGSAVGKVTGIVSGIRGKVVGALSSAKSWLKDTGRNIITGLLAGIDGALGLVRSKLSGVGKLIPGWLKKVLGINSPARATMPVGFWSMAGVADGIISGRPTIRRSLDATARTISGYRMPTPGVTSWADAWAATTGGASATNGAVTINLTVQVSPTADKVAIGREVAEVLREFYATGGARP